MGCGIIIYSIRRLKGAIYPSANHPTRGCGGVCPWRVGPATAPRLSSTTSIHRCRGSCIIRILYGCIFHRENVFRGLRFAHPRLNPVGILPPGSRPSDAQSTPLRILMLGVCDTPLRAYICGVVHTCAQQPTQRHLARANQISTTILQINLTNNCREIFSFPARRHVSDTHGFVVA